MKSIWSEYCKPKRFEYSGNKTIYDLIGIRIYKKYLPTTGDIARRRKKIKQIDPVRLGRFEALYQNERRTRNYEWRHLLGFTLFIILAFLVGRPFALIDYIFLPIFNLLLNVYPIFLQRYNRIRILDILHREVQPDPYAMNS